MFFCISEEEGEDRVWQWCLLGEEAGGKKQCVLRNTLAIPENTGCSWVLVEIPLYMGSEPCSTRFMCQEGLLISGLDCPGGKGLHIRVIKDLNCLVDSKPENRLCRGLNKSALDLWPNLIQQKIISAAY